jgi:hypothetical protein
MIVQGINTTANTLSYNNNNENVSIVANSTITIPTNVLNAFFTDPQVIPDIASGNLNLGDGINTYVGSAALQFLKNSADNLQSLDKFGTGTITSSSGAASTVVIPTTGASTVTFTLTGTWIANIILQGTNDGITWFNWGFISGGQFFHTITANGTGTSPCGSFQQLKLVATSFTSGSVNVTWNSGAGTNIVQVYNSSAAALQATALIQDSAGNSLLSINSQLETRDVLNVGSQYRAQSVTTTAAEALGASTILVNRKLLHITPTNGTIYWGYSSAVTTTTGTPLFPNNTLWLDITDNLHVWVIAAATTDSRIGELS